MGTFSAAGNLVGAFKELIVAELTPVVQIKFPYNINAEHLDSITTGSGTVAHADSMAIISTSATTSSSATIRSHDTAVYQPGQGVLCRFTAIFTPGKEGSTQEVGVGDDTDGYFIGYNGTEFGTLRRQNGVDTWEYLPQMGDGSSDFRGSIDLTKGNIFQIQYQWLGFGQITYSIFNTRSQIYEVMYRVDYPNSGIIPSTYNPSFPFTYSVSNTTNDTDIVMKSSSAAIFIEGQISQLTSRFGTSFGKTITTETNILTIRNRATFESKVNRSLVFPDLISLAADGTKTVTFNIYKDATLGGTPSYSNVSTNTSVIEVDTAGTTVTGGKLLFSVKVDKAGSQFINLGKSLKLHTNEALTITASSASSSITDVSVSWQELT